MAPGGKSRRRKPGGAGRYYLIAGLLVFVVGVVVCYVYLLPHSSPEIKPVILYVNQGNGAVNRTNFDAMASYANSSGFNTMFFQIYRKGALLFSQQDLQTFVTQAHLKDLKIFFSLYMTNPSQQIPSSIYGLGEDGVSLDMLNLSLPSQQSLLASLKASFGGETAVTTDNMYSTLKPDLLVKETYAPDTKPFIKPGIIGSVEVVATSSQADYQSQFQYALQNSDGVMVFDYAGLLKSGH
ncbi:MAG: hypothetical protein ABSB53_05805 [Nitrososphaerales archaeon]